MSQPLLVSIVIDNYNYARFLRAAIDSALAQTHPHVEVVVVDDGSTDDSRDVITGYGQRVRAVFKENGGQASAFNAGFASSRGDLVLFLDADDVLLPGAIETAVAVFAGASASRPPAKVQWLMWVVDEAGRRCGPTRPPLPPPQGDFRQVVLERGPTNCVSSPTSGNVWSRAFLEWALPVPEDVPYYRVCADEYLYTLAPVFGDVRTIPQPQGLYRVHGANVYSARTPAQKLRLELDGHEQQCRALGRFLARRGIEVDLGAWRRHSWFHRVRQSIDDINALVGEGETFILIDDGTWGPREMFATRKPVHLYEQDGADWGPPPHDEAAIAHVQTWRDEGARFLVLAWPSFWWLDHYRDFAHYLKSHFRQVLANERLVAFDLTATIERPTLAAPAGGG